MKTLREISMVAIVSICWPFVALAAHGHHQQAGSITVVGTGMVSAVPDLVLFSVGATTSNASAALALDVNNELVSRLRGVLADHQISERDVQTGRFDVSPQYKPRRSGETQPELAGYRVNHILGVRLREPDRIGELLDQLIAAGSNSLHGIQFSVAEPGSLLAEARTLAVGDALAKAQALASDAGVGLGPVLSIVEGAQGAPRPMRGGVMEFKAAAVPVAAGEQHYRVSVTVIYAIE